MRKTIHFYNLTVDDPARVDVNDSRKISWSRSLVSLRKAGKKQQFKADSIGIALYRPFCLRHFYYDKSFNHERGQMPKIFPPGASQNLVICITGPSATTGFSVLMAKYISDRHCLSTSQCYPLSINANIDDDKDESLIDEGGIRSAISDEGLVFFQSTYKGKDISKEDLFYYTYGLLHSEKYRNRFANNIKKDPPKIFPVSDYESFRAFVDAGRKLGGLHCDFEEVDMYPVQLNKGEVPLVAPADSASFYRVEKMKFAGKRPNLDKATVIYNSNITISGIPLEAYDYVVNGKPALEWVMDRQKFSKDKASGIENDPNRFAIEARNNNAAYPLELFQRVITVSLETMKIVRNLPPLDLKD